MFPKRFLLKLFLIAAVTVRLSNAKNHFKYKEEHRSTLVPATDAQKEYIAVNVCTIDLPTYLDDSEKDIQRCNDNFGWHMDGDRSGLQVRCRSETTVTLQVPVYNQYQIVLLIPHPNDDNPYSVQYNVVSPNTKYASLDTTSNTNYSVYSSVLDDRGTPLVWHREGRIFHWKLVETKNYDVRVNVTRTGNLTRGIITWNRTGDLDACFDLNAKCQRNFWPISKTVWPDSPTSIDIGNLPLNDSCFASVKGRYGSTRYQFDTYVPEEPKDQDEMSMENVRVPHEFEPVEDVYLYSEEDGDRWTVHVWWPEPLVTPDRYNVTLRADDITTLVLPGNATEAEFKEVSGKDLYNVSVYSFLGHEMAHNSKRAIFTRQTAAAATWSGRAWRWRWAGAAGGAWCVAALAAALYWRLRACPDHIIPDTKQKATVDTKPLDSARAEPARVEPPAPDAWEIKIERLLLHEVIGEGAFGVVRRGTLAPLGKEVAVKMLKDFPSMEEMRAFHVEMELMKSVGAHPHVVSLVGCCTARHPAIVAEYCSRGDLLNFLRCSWDVMVSKRNANYYNNNINASEYRNDLFKCKMQEHSRLVVNRMYDLQGVCDTELTPLDLLSFCRQIAMGMEFLALNKVVHRDLAARNILVTGDRTLKIADFGLSRDVYEENQYKQKGNGKMPVKWMALESLTRRIYTTQSDVWSFGVVVWEVVTVGGAPYAGVAAARLPRLLRAGYRMPRPPNCTHHLYELMLSCWAARPRERPTFAELHARLDELLKTASADEYLSLELDDEPPPTPAARRYIQMIIRAKRNWTRGETYERPLKAPRNHYSSPPVTNKSPV